MKKKIIIIGNGFDISLGLKTRYSDFIQNKDFSVLIRTNNNLAYFLKTKFEKANWIDIELALLEYIHKLKEQDYKEFITKKLELNSHLRIQ